MQAHIVRSRSNHFRFHDLGGQNTIDVGKGSAIRIILILGQLLQAAGVHMVHDFLHRGFHGRIANHGLDLNRQALARQKFLGILDHQPVGRAVHGGFHTDAAASAGHRHIFRIHRHILGQLIQNNRIHNGQAAFRIGNIAEYNGVKQPIARLGRYQSIRIRCDRIAVLVQQLNRLGQAGLWQLLRIIDGYHIDIGLPSGPGILRSLCSNVVGHANLRRVLNRGRGHDCRIVLLHKGHGHFHRIGLEAFQQTRALPVHQQEAGIGILGQGHCLRFAQCICAD